MRLPANIVSLCWLLPLLAVGLFAQNADKVSCPDTVQIAAPQLAKPIDGWTAYVDGSPHRLSRITLFDGPIEQQASLVPDRQRETRRGKTAVWLLKQSPERAYWLGCNYSGTLLGLSHVLPKALKECTVIYSASQKIEGMPAIKSFACK